jgi:hypothetical protein
MGYGLWVMGYGLWVAANGYRPTTNASHPVNHHTVNGHQAFFTGQKPLLTSNQSFCTGQKPLRTSHQAFCTGQKPLCISQKSFCTGQQPLRTGHQAFCTGNQSLRTSTQPWPSPTRQPSHCQLSTFSYGLLWLRVMGSTYGQRPTNHGQRPRQLSHCQLLPAGSTVNGYRPTANGPHPPNQKTANRYYPAGCWRYLSRLIFL